jgi:selenocysteine lyase/cysteine desulfurase
MENLESYFEKYRERIVGYNQTFKTPYGRPRIVYADWIASGRLYRPIEEKLIKEFGPYVGNTHTEASITGTTMTRAYQYAHELIKKDVNAGPDDVIITEGSGMTKVVTKFQRILGLKIPEQLVDYINLPEYLRPVVFITHMEHHSNHTSWLETIADVVVVEPDGNGLVDLNHLSDSVSKYIDRKLIIGAFSACSNVTGIETPYHKMAKIMHAAGGYCFIDFACSAPYAKIDMHPEDPMEKLDAVFFSPHKFLGGPGTPGVIVFDSKLYKNRAPDTPGGGTVDWTNPWGLHRFVANIEIREDGGTPGFLQAIKAGLCVLLKNEMGIDTMRAREEELVAACFKGLRSIPGLHILADNVEKRLGVVSFYIEKIHYNLMVKLLNDRFGIQVRGGCSCAGTYGHYLLHVTPNQSKLITDKIDHGDFSEKPGWVRISLHPTMTDEELSLIISAIGEIVKNIDVWEKDYTYDPHKNEYFNKLMTGEYYVDTKELFSLS